MSGRAGLLDVLCCWWICSLLLPRPRPVTRTIVVDQYGQRIGASAAEAEAAPANALPLIACATMVRDKEEGESC